MTTLSDDQLSSGDLREELASLLTCRGVLRTPAIETAFRTTSRHLFLPGVPLRDAYADTPVYTKHDASGVSVSAASQPWTVAGMLEQLSPRPGHRILEAGAGTGYNAALLAAIAGPTGHVTTIDVDDDLVIAARRHLETAGTANVDVVLSDGALGHPSGAPYDRIIATVGAWDVPPAWLDQLVPSGRLVVPLRLRGTCSRSIAFERAGGGWYSTSSAAAVFMPLRGIGDDARRNVTLAEGISLQVHKDQQAEGRELTGVLETTRHEGWTGVMFPPEVSYEWLDLWLCVRLPAPLMRMNISPYARDTGLVTPMFPWGSMATAEGGNLAYLTTRPAPSAPDGGRLYEIGVISHGPGGPGIATRTAQEIQAWDSQYRGLNVRFELPDQPHNSDPASGRYLLPRPHRPITVTWY
jgi:protein-L-isoaspartate(D-aspartate) O-methyltransferase